MLTGALRPFRLELAGGLSTAHGELREREGIAIIVRDGARTGFGEAAPLLSFTGETFEGCLAAATEAIARLRGAAPPEDAAALVGWLSEFLAPLARTPAARCGVEQALLDLCAQRAGVPLARFLHPGAATSVGVSALLSAQTPGALATEARAAAQAGFRTVKLKVGHGSLDEDHARCAAVRAAAQGELRLRIDANGAWSGPRAQEALTALSAYDLELCEQPVPARDVAGLRALRGAQPVRIAADESMTLDAAGVLAAPRAAADVLVLKPQVLGGLLPALAWAAEGARQGLALVATTSLDGAVGRAGAAHLAAALCGFAPQPDAGLATGALLLADLCEDPAAPRGGRIALPARPGLGFAPDALDGLP